MKKNDFFSKKSEKKFASSKKCYYLCIAIEKQTIYFSVEQWDMV